MNGQLMARPIAIATAVCGTLDILFAMILTLWFGREVGNMLRYVGSGPFPAATDMGTAGAIIGLLVHFTLMLVMVVAFMIAARRWPSLLDRPAVSGVAYGLATYAAMNWIVVPVRFDAPLPPSPIAIATQLFAHIVLVGLPTAFIARRYLRG